VFLAREAQILKSTWFTLFKQELDRLSVTDSTGYIADYEKKFLELSKSGFTEDQIMQNLGHPAQAARNCLPETLLSQSKSRSVLQSIFTFAFSLFFICIALLILLVGWSFSFFILLLSLIAAGVLLFFKPFTALSAMGFLFVTFSLLTIVGIVVLCFMSMWVLTSRFFK
jgi:uncharacterized membrane protein